MDKAALEFATRDMYNHAHGHKGSGYKTNFQVTDFWVAHLSGTEHALVRRHGYDKGLALTNVSSTHALEVVLARHAIGETSGGGGAGGAAGADLRRRSLVLVPFYGGVASVELDKVQK